MKALNSVPDDVCRPCSRGQHDMCTLHERCGCEDCNPPVVVWEDPPSGRGRRPFVLPADALAALRANPGRWARLKEFGSKRGAATAAKKQREVEPDFEFLGRAVGNGSAMYGRYVGASSS